MLEWFETWVSTADQWAFRGSVAFFACTKVIVSHAAVKFWLLLWKPGWVRDSHKGARYRVKVQTFDTGQLVQTGFIAIMMIA